VRQEKAFAAALPWRVAGLSEAKSRRKRNPARRFWLAMSAQALILHTAEVLCGDAKKRRVSTSFARSFSEKVIEEGYESIV
jgi:hypothetical protein